jgi:hypothetical protein
LAGASRVSTSSFFGYKPATLPWWPLLLQQPTPILNWRYTAHILRKYQKEKLTFNAFASCYIKMVLFAVVAVFAVAGYVLPKRAALQIRHKHTSYTCNKYRYKKRNGSPGDSMFWS